MESRLPFFVLCEQQADRRGGDMNGATELHESNPLTQRLKWMETNGHILSSGGQRLAFSSLQTSWLPTHPCCRQDMVSI